MKEAEGEPTKSRDQVKAEREAKKLAKQAKKKGQSVDKTTDAQTEPKPVDTKPAAEKKATDKAAAKPQTGKENKPLEQKPTADDEKSKEAITKAQLKAARRAIQEAQRAKKNEGPTPEMKKPVEVAKKEEKGVKVVKRSPSPSRTKVPLADARRRVKLFAHLYAKMEMPLSGASGAEDVHSSIARLGAQYRNRTICGSNARVLALLNALTQVISDYRTPPKEEFSRGLDAEISRCVSYLQRCRPAAVSMGNAVRHLKQQVTQSKSPEADAKAELIDWIDTYVKDQLEKAAEQISMSVTGKIANGDVILTYSCSSLIEKCLMTAARAGIAFRVIVVDGRPWLEGREMLRRLLLAGIQCTYVLVNAVSFVMSEVTKILLGAHALLANGYVMSRCGSSQIALLGRAANVPVLVCCETHKFSERVQTDSFVHNEIGNPDDLLKMDPLLDGKQPPQSLTPLNLAYDVTPPDLVSAVVTELAVLPCTSVPVILRIK